MGNWLILKQSISTIWWSLFSSVVILAFIQQELSLDEKHLTSKAAEGRQDKLLGFFVCFFCFQLGVLQSC